MDVVIIGAGPAGLAAAASLSALTQNFLLIDAGGDLAERDRHDPGQVTSGVGGAGLFSDGKFSFYPAASGLWDLPDRAALRRAYAATAELLGRHGVPCPPFPTGTPLADEPLQGRWWRKEYPAHYMPLEQRARMIDELFAPLAHRGRHLLCTSVLRIDPGGRRGQEHRLLLQDLRSGQLGEIHARHVLLCGGRFHPVALSAQSGDGGVPLRFRRLEFGVRIEDEAGGPLFGRLRGVDPKYRLTSPCGRIEWRTFCCCRDGEIVAGQACGLFTASGRADGPATGRSNIGLLARLLDEQLAEQVGPDVFAAALRERSLFRLPLPPLLLHGEGLSVLEGRFGRQGAAHVLRGLQALQEELPELVAGHAQVVGPTIEGVGRYPVVDGKLQAGRTGLWAAGDCCGRFRGIVASMVSGHYAAEQIGRCLDLRTALGAEYRRPERGPR